MSLLPDQHRSVIMLQAAPREVGETLVAWGRRVGRYTSASRHRMPLREAWSLLEPRSTPPTKAMLVGVPGGWTAFFNNGLREDIDGGIGFNIAELLGVAAYAFLYDADEDGPSASFHAWSPNAAGGNPVERCVLLYKESSWVFWQSGEPLPFEQMEAYGRPRKRDRLDAEMLRSYAAALGLRISEPEGYTEEVLVLHERGGPPVEPRAGLAVLQGLARKVGGRLRLLGGGGR